MEIFTEEIRVFSKATPLVLYLSWIGEGDSGDYDDDSEDTPLMRFDLWFKESASILHEVRDASYCTNIDARDTKEHLTELAEMLLSQFEAAYDGSDQEAYHPKRLAEQLSWMGSDGGLYSLPVDFLRGLPGFLPNPHPYSR